MMQRDIDPRHLLRLGGGEKDITLRDALEGEEQERFSKQGRVNWSLQRRIDVLAEVQRLAVSLGAHGDMGASCETAEYFYRDWISPLMAKHGKGGAFPFKEFFNDVSELVAGTYTFTYDSILLCLSGLIVYEDSTYFIVLDSIQIRLEDDDIWHMSETSIQVSLYLCAALFMII